MSAPGWNAVTRYVSTSIADCELTHLAREPIDLPRARRQHAAYERLLSELGCELHQLAAEPGLADAVFVEDTAVVFDELAVIARPGAVLRRFETSSVAVALTRFRPLIHIKAPATLDGGDVLQAGRKVWIGRSSRTDREGAAQLRAAIEPHGYSVDEVEISRCLHLKSAATRVADDLLLVNPDWVDPGSFDGMKLLTVDPSEPFAANALAIGDTVVHAAAFPATRRRLEAAGLEVVVVDLSELAKAEGAVTCCSLVFRR